MPTIMDDVYFTLEVRIKPSGDPNFIEGRDFSAGMVARPKHSHFGSDEEALKALQKIVNDLCHLYGRNKS